MKVIRELSISSILAFGCLMKDSMKKKTFLFLDVIEYQDDNNAHE